MKDFEIILLVKKWPINRPIKLYKGGEITLLESLEKEIPQRAKSYFKRRKSKNI